MNLTKRIFLPVVTIILLLCFMEKPIKIEAKQETDYLHSSKISQTRTAKHSNLLMPLSLPKAGEAKASLPHMRRIALNPTQYQITLKHGVGGMKRDTEILYSDQSSTKTDGFKSTKSDGFKKDQNCEPRECSETTKSHTTIVTHASTISEKQLLYSLVQAEAGNQDVDGCRLVADVVLNRMASNKFPSDMEDVIYSPGQFSVVRNGSLEKARGEISEKVIQAVDMELSNTRLDNTVLYFNNSNNGGWKYGDHYFK